jgi:hypothetical protein
MYIIAIINYYQGNEHHERTRIITDFTIAVLQEGKHLCFSTIIIDFRHTQRQEINSSSIYFHCKLPYSCLSTVTISITNTKCDGPTAAHSAYTHYQHVLIKSRGNT